MLHRDSAFLTPYHNSNALYVFSASNQLIKVILYIASQPWSLCLYTSMTYWGTVLPTYEKLTSLLVWLHKNKWKSLGACSGAAPSLGC